MRGFVGNSSKQMTIEEKFRQLQRAVSRAKHKHLKQPAKLPRSHRLVEECIKGRVARNEWGGFFMTQEALPFGRPYGKLRIGDIAVADLSPLNVFLKGSSLPSNPSRLVYLDIETAHLPDGPGACAFLVGLGSAEGAQFLLRQFFLRRYKEEKAMLAALAEAIAGQEALVTYNGKAFDVPVLEARYSAVGLPSPFDRLIHLDLLHPVRRLWKRQLANCRLKSLEEQILGIERNGDVPGAEIPGIYFDYLRTGDACGLQPVFFHNALDIVSLAAAGTEMGRVLGDPEELLTVL